MATVLGLYKAERLAPIVDEFLGADASLAWLQIGDSNLGQGGAGYGRADRLTISALTNRPVIATHTCTTGPHIQGGSLAYSPADLGVTSDHVPSTLSTEGAQYDQTGSTAGGQDYSGLSSLLTPFLPKTAAMLLVDLFVPAIPDGTQVGSVRYALMDQALATGADTSLQYNFNASFKVYIAHPIQSTFGSNTWQVRKQTGPANVVNGTINHATGGPVNPAAAAIAITNVATVSADSFGVPASPVLQFMPYSNLSTPTGPEQPPGGPFGAPNMILSMFATWPNRGHGYLVAPIIYAGGRSLGEYVTAIADASNEWTDWKLMAAATAMEGRRSYMIFEIAMLLNDNTNEATFLTRFTTATNHLLARFDALKASGDIPSNVIDAIVLFSGCRHRIPVATEDIRYGFNAARTLADSNSRVVVADFQDMMRDADLTDFGDGTAHLDDGNQYLTVSRRWFSRLFAACRIQRVLRGIT